MCTCVCVYTSMRAWVCACHSMCFEVRRRLSGIILSFQCQHPGLNSGHQACTASQVFLPAEHLPSPYIRFLNPYEHLLLSILFFGRGKYGDRVSYSPDWPGAPPCSKVFLELLPLQPLSVMYWGYRHVPYACLIYTFFICTRALSMFFLCPQP